MTQYDIALEELDIEPYEGHPDFDSAQAVDLDGTQDDEGLGGLLEDIKDGQDKGVSTWQEMREWYKTHNTTEELGYNPDGMCLKICRNARNVFPFYASAKACQDAVREAGREAFGERRDRGREDD